MAATVTALGSASTTTGASGPTLALTLGTAVAAGSLIVVMVTEGDNLTYSTGCSVSDTAGNTYTAISSANLANVTTAGFAQIFYAKNVTALSSGNAITVTKQDTNAALVVEAIAATGIDTASPLDTAVTQSATGLTASPSVTSGVGAQAGNLIVGAMAWQDTTAATATQPGGSWTADANTKNASATTRGDGATIAHLVNTGATAQTYAPTLSASNRWTAFIVGFKVTRISTPKTIAIGSTTSVVLAKSHGFTAVIAIACATALVLSRLAKTARKTVAIACASSLSTTKTAGKIIRITATSTTAAMRFIARVIEISASTSVSILTTLHLRVVIAKIRTFITAYFGKATVTRN